MNDQARKEILDALSDYFEPDEVEWKPQAVKGNRALAIGYIDARCVMDRLDNVLGVGNWQTSYREFGAGVVCTLRVRVCGEWSEHEDAGSFSDQPDKGDQLKAALSDSLKRAAVHLGVGRYLYALPSQWVDYDPQKKSFVRKPELPAWARPRKAGAQPSRPAPAAPPPPAEPDHDPAEVVGAEQVAELEALLTAKNKRWDAARKWLQDTFFRELEPQAQTADLCWKHFLALRNMLTNPPRKQKAG